MQNKSLICFLLESVLTRHTWENVSKYVKCVEFSGVCFREAFAYIFLILHVLPDLKKGYTLCENYFKYGN